MEFQFEKFEPAEVEEPITAEEALELRSEIMAELDALREKYTAEGEKACADAKAWAEDLVKTTEEDIQKLLAATEDECANKRKTAGEEGFKDGYERGFGEGWEKGTEDGYQAGLGKCRDTLDELLAMLKTIDDERERYFKEYENKLFDTIFTIANKITIDSLKQKEKAVISKMLREAAKSYRNSEYIKITLSKLDIEEMGTAGMDSLREIFRENQHVEWEVVKDAPEGTLILDNDSEITDAGVATQLMMIEKLGKGKFRDKTDEEDA
jgi:flagellar assembly protein FliH